jgi:opacity protein-like surface antigen
LTKRLFTPLALPLALSLASPVALAKDSLYDMGSVFSQPHPFDYQVQAPPPLAWRPAPAVGPIRHQVPAAGRGLYATPAAPRPTPAPATDSGYGFKDGLYLAGTLFGTHSITENHELTGASNLETRHEEDQVAGNSLAIGYAWADKLGHPIRTELEGGVRYRFDLNYRATMAGTINGYATNLATLYTMVNTYYDIDLDSKWTPYTGFGLGYAHHFADTERRAVGGALAHPNRDETTKTGNFSWALMGGVAYDWTPRWRGILGGRYINLGNVDVGPFSESDKITTDYWSMDLILGITYDM